MSLLREIRETRSASLANPPGWLVEALGAGGKTYAGKRVTPGSSLELVPVFSAVSLLAGAVASLPLIVYTKADPRTRAETSRQWALLHDQPNPEMAADELQEIKTKHLLTWGNAFEAKVAGGDGRVAELWPIRPERCQVARIDGVKLILVDGKPYTERDILHTRGLGDGLVGLSPIQQAREMLGTTLAQQEYAGTFWANGTLVSGFLHHPNELTDGARKRLERWWRKRAGGLSNAGSVPILEEGLTYEPATMPMQDAQFIEQAKLGDLRVAQLFRVPPYMLGAEIGSSLTYSTTESQGVDFIRWSLGRWLTRIEKSFKRDPEIFPPSLNLTPEFLLDALLRGTTKERYESYEIGVRSRILKPNEARAAENLPPYDGGDTFPERTSPPEPR